MSFPFPKGSVAKCIWLRLAATCLSVVIISMKQPNDPSPPRTAIMILIPAVCSKKVCVDRITVQSKLDSLYYSNLLCSYIEDLGLACHLFWKLHVPGIASAVFIYQNSAFTTPTSGIGCYDNLVVWNFQRSSTLGFFIIKPFSKVGLFSDFLEGWRKWVGIKRDSLIFAVTGTHTAIASIAPLLQYPWVWGDNYRYELVHQEVLQSITSSFFSSSSLWNNTCRVRVLLSTSC